MPVEPPLRLPPPHAFLSIGNPFLSLFPSLNPVTEQPLVTESDSWVTPARLSDRWSCQVHAHQSPGPGSRAPWSADK